MRYERKFKIDHLALHLVEQTIRLHPAAFRKIFPDRKVNNIYFDTPDLTTFKENVMGIADRKKFRIRWYGNPVQEISNPVFEIKIKKNQLGDKISKTFPAFNLSQLNFSDKVIKEFSESTEVIYPTLLNSYLRSYYGTSDGKFRLTIDRKMQYSSFVKKKKFLAKSIEDQGVIMELKYDEHWDGTTDFITQYFPYRMTKSSKYVTGMELVNY